MWIPQAIETAGSLASSAFNYFQQREQRDWEENMSNTAHQREMRDLQRAGLNPILTATGGRGASVPSMAPAHAENPFAGAASNAVAAARVKNETAYNELAMEKLAKDVKLTDVQAEYIRAQTKAALAQAGLSTWSAREKEAGLPETELRATLWRVISNSLDGALPGWRKMGVQEIWEKGTEIWKRLGLDKMTFEGLKNNPPDETVHRMHSSHVSTVPEGVVDVRRPEKRYRVPDWATGNADGGDTAAKYLRGRH